MATKTVTLAELQQNATKESCYLVIDGKVYNVTSFVDEHPGGDEVILSEAGKNATEAFEDVGHSDEARGMLTKMLVGDFEGGLDQLKAVAAEAASTAKAAASKSSSSPTTMYFVPLAALGGYLAWRYYAGQ